MKNLKTIITLLVLTMTVFSCQTNDELVEMEEMTFSKSLEEVVDDEVSYSEVLITYDLSIVDSEFKRQEIRLHYKEFHLGEFVIIKCSTLSDNQELWRLENPLTSRKPNDEHAGEPIKPWESKLLFAVEMLYGNNLIRCND